MELLDELKDITSNLQDLTEEVGSIILKEATDWVDLAQRLPTLDISEKNELISEFNALQASGLEFEDIFDDDEFPGSEELEDTIDELENYWYSEPADIADSQKGQANMQQPKRTVRAKDDNYIYIMPLEITVTKEMTVINRNPGDVLEARKVGDAINPEIRLKQHAGATTTHYGDRPRYIGKPLYVGSRRDYDLHPILKANPKIIWDDSKDAGIWNSREVFYMRDPKDPISYIDEIVSKWASGSKDFYKRDDSKEPYDRQRSIIEQAKKILKQRNRVLVEAAPRTGKSFMALIMAQELGCKTALILTPFPDADGSFRDVVLLHTKFAGSNFRDAREMDSVGFDESYDEDGIQTIMMSWALLNDEKEKLKELFNQHIDVIIVDETHRQSDTERSESLLSKLDHTYEIHLSGTPYNDKLSGRFSEMDTITYDYLDRLVDAENAKRKLKTERDPIERKKLEFLASMPRLQFYLIDQMEAATEYYQQQYPDFKVEDNLTLEKFFSPQMPDAVIKMFFRDLATTRQDPLHPGLIDGERAREFNHILAFVPSIEAADRIKRIMEEVVAEGAGWAGYHVMSVSGIEELESYDNVEKCINDAQARHGKTFTISVGKATTGVTLPKLSSVWILRRMKSAEQFVQIALRAGTPDKGKQSVNVTCFDSEMAISAQAVIAQMRAQATGEDVAEIMRVLVKCLPTLVYDGKTFDTPFSVEEILDLSRDLLLQPLSHSDIDLTEIDLVDLQSLARLAGLRSIEKYTKVIGTGGQAGGKNARVTRSGNTRKLPIEELTPEDYKKIKAGIIEVCKHLDWVVRRGIKTVRDMRESPMVLTTLGVTQPELDAILDVVGTEKIQELMSRFEMKDKLFIMMKR